MSRTEVVQVMGREPDCVIAAPNSTALYFTRVPEERVGCTARVGTWDELPVIYAAVEVALDGSG